MAEQTEDLKAFERRLTEVIDKLQPAARGWRMLLIVVSILTAVGAWAWLWDPRTSERPKFDPLELCPLIALAWKTVFLVAWPLQEGFVLDTSFNTAFYTASTPGRFQVSFTQSLLYHPIFALSCFILLLLFLCGIHKRVVAPSIIAARCRLVLAEYNMSCDDTGKLILKPRPST